MPTMKSYFLENMILNYYNAFGRTSTQYIDIELPKLFEFVYNQVHQPLYDPKGYQGNINHLTWDECNSIRTRAKLDFDRANVARQLETDGKQKESIEKWREIFGLDFPPYTA